MLPEHLDIEWRYLGILGFENAKQANRLAIETTIEMVYKWVGLVNEFVAEVADAN